MHKVDGFGCDFGDFGPCVANSDTHWWSEGEGATACGKLETKSRSRSVQFRITVVDHQLADKKYRSVVISGLAVSG